MLFSIFPPPWHFTTWLDLFDHWQTLAAGLLALLAALIAVGGSEWRARTAVRALLASEVRLYVDLLTQMRETLKTGEPVFEDGKDRPGDFKALTLLRAPTVYPAVAGGTMGLLRRPLAADVAKFYATLERLNFVATAATNGPTEKISMSDYRVYIGLIEQVCQTSLPLLSEFPFDKRDAVFRARIAKWDAAEAGAGITETSIKGRRALTARRLNTVGLVLGITGVLVIFIWGPPQPNFDEFVPLALEGPEFEHQAEDARRLKRQYEIMSRVGLGLIGLGFVAQLAAVRRAPR